MKIGDSVRFKPEDWGTPLEDRPLGVVLSEPYKVSSSTQTMMVDIQFPGASEVYSTSFDTLEVVSENR